MTARWWISCPAMIHAAARALSAWSFATPFRSHAAGGSTFQQGDCGGAHRHELVEQ